MKMTTTTFAIAVATCFATIAASSYVLPGAGMGLSVVAYAVIIAVALCVLRASGIDSATTRIITLISSTLSVALAIVNINYFTAAVGHTAADPVLQNFDAMRDWTWACHLVFGDPEPDLFISGMSYMTAGILWAFGRSIAYPIFFVSLCYAISIVMIGSIAYKLTDRREVGTIAMAVGAMMCFLLAHSSVLVKDLPVTCMFAITIHRIVCIYRQHRSFTFKDLAILTPTLALLLLARHNMAFMLTIGCLLFMVDANRRTRLSLVILAGVALIGGQIVNRMIMPSPDNIINTISAEKCALMILHDDTTRPWDNIVGDYTQLPFYIKVLWLPISVAIQFLLPFPWGFERHMCFGPGVAIAHFSYFWYAAGALILYWIFACARKAPRSQQLLIAWGVMLTIITAYMSSGRIARYCLPYLPLLLPAAAIVIADCRQRRSLWIWLGIFTTLLTAALIICYSMQHPS